VAQHLDQRRNLQRHQQRTAAAAKGATRRRAIGSMAMSVFVLLTCLMAAYALHVEQRQQLKWEQVR
jgi:hypothetical protein